MQLFFVFELSMLLEIWINQDLRIRNILNKNVKFSEALNLKATDVPQKSIIL